MKIKLLLLILTIMLLNACEKYRDFDNLEASVNTYTGTISITESAGDIDGDFSGTDDSGAYGFIWDNPTKGAVLTIDVVPAAGTVQFIVEDSRGNEVLNAAVSGASNLFLIEGKKGKWQVRIVFFEFEGQGNFDLNPVN